MKSTCIDVFATAGYEMSIANLAATSLAPDNVFSDGGDRKTPIMTGDVARGYVAILTIQVAT